MTAIIFTPDRDSKSRKSDFRGAFDPEARAFAKLHGVAVEQIIRVDQTLEHHAKRSVVIEALANCPEVEVAAFFCHGTRTAMHQMGFMLPQVPELAHALADVGIQRVALMACSTAGGPGQMGNGGFADTLRDAMNREGLASSWVDGHDREGHTTRNPYVRRFHAALSDVGGEWIVAPGTPLWRAWRLALQSRASTLRLRFPTMTIAEIHAELGGAS
jgi:hypothetical protein